jgi:predicted nuclease of predicted toxin-antitoxin system
MKFLVDANLSPRVAARLCDGGGYEASHVHDHGLLNASDEAILRHALDAEHVIISADSDFATMLALTGMASPSLILLRSADHLNPEEQADLLLVNLAKVLQDLHAGCVVSISRNHLRVRSLPIQH